MMSREQTATAMTISTAPHATTPMNAPTTAQTEPKKLAVEVTPKAIDAIKRQIQKRGTPNASLRIGIKGGGCSGFSYVIQFHDGEPHARDKVFDLTAADGTAVRVVCDPKSLLYLHGATLDWEQTLMQQGFKWINPHEKTSCGCGHSFTV
jgi:iron-sulfur cluster assembly protein